MNRLEYDYKLLYSFCIPLQSNYLLVSSLFFSYDPRSNVLNIIIVFIIIELFGR